MSGRDGCQTWGSAGLEKLPKATQTEPRMYLDSSLLPTLAGSTTQKPFPSRPPSKCPQQTQWSVRLSSHQPARASQPPAAASGRPPSPGRPSPAPPASASWPPGPSSSPCPAPRHPLGVSSGPLGPASSALVAASRPGRSGVCPGHAWPHPPATTSSGGTSPPPASPLWAGGPGGAWLRAATSSPRAGPASVATSEHELQPRERISRLVAQAPPPHPPPNSRQHS